MWAMRKLTRKRQNFMLIQCFGEAKKIVSQRLVGYTRSLSRAWPFGAAYVTLQAAHKKEWSSYWNSSNRAQGTLMIIVLKCALRSIRFNPAKGICNKSRAQPVYDLLKNCTFENLLNCSYRSGFPKLKFTTELLSSFGYSKFKKKQWITKKLNTLLL
jgi:hypothetical protein